MRSRRLLLLEDQVRNSTRVLSQIKWHGTKAIDATYFRRAHDSGSGNTDIRGLAVDAAGNVNVAGGTQAMDLPLRNPLTSVMQHWPAPMTSSGPIKRRPLQSSVRHFLNPIDSNAQFADWPRAERPHPSVWLNLFRYVSHHCGELSAGSPPAAQPTGDEPQDFYCRHRPLRGGAILML